MGIYLSPSIHLAPSHPLNMAIRMMPCCQEKAVSVTVYVECPRKRRISGNRHHDQRHNHYVHQTIGREVILYNKGASDHKGYNRRAQLLQYSQHLRKSAQSASTSSSPSSLKSTSSSDHNPTSQLVAGHRKSKHVRAPACLGSCKIVVPNFLACLTSFIVKKDRKKKKHAGSTSNKIKTMMTSFVMQKKKLQFLWSNYYSALRKRRY